MPFAACGLARPPATGGKCERMAARAGLLRAFDAALVRGYAIALALLAEGWLRGARALRRRNLIGRVRFLLERRRADLFSRRALHAASVWLDLTRR